MEFFTLSVLIWESLTGTIIHSFISDIGYLVFSDSNSLAMFSISVSHVLLSISDTRCPSNISTQMFPNFKHKIVSRNKNSEKQIYTQVYKIG